METLAWNRNESDVVQSGRVYYAPTTDVTTSSRKGSRVSTKFLPLYAVLVTLGKVRSKRKVFVFEVPTAFHCFLYFTEW